MTLRLTPRHVFGFVASVTGAVSYRDESVVVYPAGHGIVEYNTDNRSQRLVQAATGSGGVSAMACHPNRKFTAFAERGDHPSVTVWDWGSGRSRRRLTGLDVGSSYIHSLSFSSDGKTLYVQGGAPEWTLLYVGWEKGKVITSVKVSTPAGAAVNQCDCAPDDSSVVCVSGAGFVKLFRVADNVFKPHAVNIRTPPQNYLCHAWLPDERLVVGAANGEILLFEGLEFRTALSTAPNDGKPVSALCPLAKGFVAGCGSGVVRVYEREDTGREYFKHVNRFKVGVSDARVSALSVSPTEDNLACGTSDGQLFHLGLGSSEMVLNAEEMKFDPLVTLFHGPNETGHAGVTGLDACIRKPLVVTCGADRTVRVWNMNMESPARPTLELVKSFSEDCGCVALHPSGLHVLVGFTSSLHLMNILMDDLLTALELPVKACTEARFSNGGHLYAAANGTVVNVYAMYTGEQLFALRGHGGRVVSIAWAVDDVHILSASTDGTLYRWDVRDGTPLCHFGLPDVLLTCVTPSRDDGGEVFIVGDSPEGAAPALRAIEFGATERDCRAVLEVDTAGTPFGAALVAPSGTMLFVGSADPRGPGVVRCYRLPFSGDFQEVVVHGGAVVRLALSPDEAWVYSAGCDGSVSVCSTLKEGAVVVTRRDREAPLPVMEEILVTRQDLQERNAQMTDLKSRIEALEKHNKYKLGLKSVNYEEKLREVEERFLAEVSTDKSRLSALRDEKQDMEMEYDEQIAKLEATHAAELDELDATYKAKIRAEIERYNALVRERDRMTEAWDEAARSMVESHEAHVGALRAQYTAALEEEEGSRHNLEEQRETLKAEVERRSAAIEEDADMEIEELKARYSARLDAEHRATLLLRGDNAVMKKRFISLNQEIGEKKEEIKALHERERESYERIKTLEKDILGHKKEIREREETITDKERRIYDLRKKNQELEKFKFVLNYKIQELKRQILPRKKEIADMREQIKEMELELLQYHKSNAALDLMIGELRLKKAGMQREIDALSARIALNAAVLTRLRVDMHDTVQVLGDHKALKARVMSLYRQYVHDAPADGGPGPVTGTGEVDMQREYARQREYLEKSIESLTRKLEKDSTAFEADRARLQREAATLTAEINALRRELKYMQGHAETPAVPGAAKPPRVPGPPRPASTKPTAVPPSGSTGVTGVTPHPPAAGVSRPTSRFDALGSRSAGSAAVGLGGYSDFDARREVEIQRATIEQLQSHLEKLRDLVAAEPGLGVSIALGEDGARPTSRGSALAPLEHREGDQDE